MIKPCKPAPQVATTSNRMSEPVSSTLCNINPLTQGRSSDQLQMQTQPWDSGSVKDW